MPWKRLTPRTAPVGRPFLVRSFSSPLGFSVAFADGRLGVLGIAQRGTGSKPGMWVMKEFWPDRMSKAYGPLHSRLWTEFCEIDGTDQASTADTLAGVL